MVAGEHMDAAPAGVEEKDKEEVDVGEERRESREEVLGVQWSSLMRAVSVGAPPYRPISPMTSSENGAAGSCIADAIACGANCDVKVKLCDSRPSLDT